MKRRNLFTTITCILMAAAMVFVLAACGGSSQPAATEAAEAADEAVTEAAEAAADAAQEAADSDLAKVQDAGKLIVGITDFAPMDYKDGDDWTGFDAELAKKVAAELGVEAEFQEIDWDNKILDLNAGTVDCIWNGMTLTDEVKNSMDCTDPYILNKQVVVMKADAAADYPDADSMMDLSFAVEAGSAGANAAYDTEFPNVTEVNTQSTALMEVAAGTNDACVIDATMAAAMTGEGTSYEDLVVVLELTEEYYGIGFRQGSDLLPAVSDLLAQYTEDGSLQELAEKYHLELAQ